MRAKITKRWWIFRLWLTSLVIIIIVELVQWLLFPIIFACSPPAEGSPLFCFSSRDCARPSISPWADASQQLVCRVAIARQFGFASVLVLSRLFVCYPAPSQMIKCLLVFASPRDRSHSRHSAPSLASELFRLSSKVIDCLAIPRPQRSSVFLPRLAGLLPEFLTICARSS